MHPLKKLENLDSSFNLFRDQLLHRCVELKIEIRFVTGLQGLSL